MVSISTVGKKVKINKWRITNMKNVKVILIGVALCATVFANARIEALGGDAGFWPGDRANAEMFPGTLNDANWVEFGGVEGANGPSASINWGDDVKWGFNLDADANTDWVNMTWAKDGMGLSVGFTSASDADGNGATSADASGFDVAWGSTMSFGELGVGYSSSDSGVTGSEASTSLWAAWRGSCNAWLFDNAKAGFMMNDEGNNVTSTVLTYDLFTHVKPADGVTALLGMGFAYATGDLDANTDFTQMWLPNTILAVEATMTDWATVRTFVRQTHVFSNEAGGVDGDTGNQTDYGFGAGFGWTAANGSSVSLDMEVSNNLFNNPIGYMTGYAGNLANGEVTISYEF